jgi:SAM-dependent methyltransferase
MGNNYKRFSKLGFDDFRIMASDESLSKYEKIGFPDEYRKGKEHLIFADIRKKLPRLDQASKTILDIGPGCSDLAHYLIANSESLSQELIFVDSEEMLRLLPDSTVLRKEAAYYPNCPDLLDELAGRVDAIICYSVFHYIFEESNTWDFLDRSLALLAPGGRFLIGDIPNVSKRKRFFASETGIKHHKAFMQTDEAPVIEFNRIEPDTIDDAVVMALIMRARLAGFDAYLVPQSEDLPMANRREDILIVRP